MAISVKLSEIDDGLNMAADEMSTYPNLKTGEVMPMTDEDLSYAEKEDLDGKYIPEWQLDVIKIAKEILSSDDYIKLPEKFEINDYAAQTCVAFLMESDFFTTLR